MSLITVDPRTLHYSPWNVNAVSPENQAKLERSIERLGQFRPVIVRETENGLEIIAGEHTTRAMISKGYDSIDVYNLGEVSDEKAKAISVADNRQWGEEDGLALANLLQEIGGEEIADFLPYTEEDLTGIFSATEIDLDGLDFPDDEEEPSDSSVDDMTGPTQTHEVMRFKVPIQDREFVASCIEAIIRRQGLSDPDSGINAGDALVHLCRSQGGHE